MSNSHYIIPFVTIFRKQASLWAAGDVERAKRFSREGIEKSSKADKLEKLDKLEKQEKLERLEQQMLTQIRAGVNTMMLDSKQLEMALEESLVCGV